ncbi:S26 family signal peptidase [Bradyrhizobium sp. dw_78]|uniref:S26 family signal peptidase n=1 Tax=Bradyrhizobium sp. dw_78 TaxID=2719793 RepID=UPI001BD520A9|nr:S26 family signal peptidase [Bradyrhizobium sp. dw_78]
MTRRTALIVVTLLGVAILVPPIGSKPLPHYIWNLTPSVPLGLYGVRPPDELRVTSLVVAIPPEPLATLLADGGYLAHGVPLLKRIFALSGQIECRLHRCFSGRRQGDVAHMGDRALSVGVCLLGRGLGLGGIASDDDDRSAFRDKSGRNFLADP